VAVAPLEAAARLPLRWGTYDGRRWAGLTLIVGGLVHLQAAGPDSLLPLAVGTVAHVVGWLIMPARGWRRVVPIVLSTFVGWLLLAGPQLMWTLTIPFLFWLLVRHRPWRSLLAVSPVLLNGVIAAAVFREYEGMPLALGASALVIVGSAWWAAAIARRAHSDSH